MRLINSILFILLCSPYMMSQSNTKEPVTILKAKAHGFKYVMKKIGHSAWYYPAWPFGKLIYLTANDK